VSANDATNGSNGDDRYFTLAGQDRRLFATRSLRIPELDDGGGDGERLPRHTPTPPAVAAMRRLLRDRLPGIYHQDGDFGLRFVGSLETVLDPVLALLDSLPAHIDPDLAPQDMLELLAGWLGVELDESWPDERRRELVRRAGELSRLKGTRAGLELALGISFPDLPLRIEDEGGVVYATDDAEAVGSERPRFIVYCDTPLEEDLLARVARAIEQAKPVHVAYRLRVKAPRKPQA
jgi:phage tail-like protein